MNKSKQKTASIFFKHFFQMFAVFIFLVLPASTNYKLKDYGFGSGGVSNATGGGFSLEAITGEMGGGKSSGGGISLEPGLIFAGQANVPAAPTFTNPSNYYNKLNLIISPSANPSDTKFAIAISADNFVTTNYVQSDNTVGAVLGAEDYQIYSAWGGAGGITVIGLSPSATYKVKVKAMQGRFSETGYGPEASAATVSPTLAFGVKTDNQTVPPFSIDFGSLVPNTINSSPHNIEITLDTNGANGGKVYVFAGNAGLFSTVANYKINAVSGNLTSLGEGFGAQGVSATQTSGGPLTIATLYDQGGEIVGATDQTVRDIFNTANPIIGGAGSFLLKAKPASVAPAANDYAETLTVIASGSF